MSRVIVKNLPSGIKEERLRNIFAEEGHITDCSLKYTKEGRFRKFAFIGYSTEHEASQAVTRRDKSFIDTSRIHVELAKDLGDNSKARAWSKYSAESSAYQKSEQKRKESEQHTPVEEPTKKKKKSSEEHVKEMLGDLKDDAGFHEFVSLHQNKTNKASWADDVAVNHQTKDSEPTTTEAPDEIDERQEGDSPQSSSGESSEEEDDIPMEETIATKNEISNFDYLKAKKVTNESLWSDADSESSDDSGSDDVGAEGSKPSTSKAPKQDSSSDDDDSTDDADSDSDENDDDDDETDDDAEASSGKEISRRKKSKASDVDKTFRFIIKMRGLPTTVKEGQIREFFKPVVPTAVKIPRNAKGNQAFCIATVEFKDESQQDAAMGKNKNYIGPKKIFLHKTKEKVLKVKSTEQSKPWEKNEKEEVESIGESGRLYVRNLAYICKEEDLETLFGKYGPLAEVHLPLDRFTRKIKGFAFVTFVIPEHAVKAHAELDGTTFQGRLLHIIPGKAKEESEAAESADAGSFKKKKEAKQKAHAGSSHNWNTLFLGTNAVVDVMSEKYGAKKSDILKAEGKESLGVRLALGETQVVAETRDFLVENGIALDSFSQAAASRSKTVLLAKNLPAGTKAEELRDMFGRFGNIGRVVLPPSGVTAVIEYLEPTEARSGFQRLAYTKFQHLPLYLEWAPVDVFGKPAEAQQKQRPDQAIDDTEPSSSAQQNEDEDESSSSDEDTNETGRTLFVKNINFLTTESSVKELFKDCGPIKAVTIAKKRDLKNPGKVLSMGYGFVEYKTQAACAKALKDLQHSSLDDHQLELKASNRATVQAKPTEKKKKQDSTKKQKTSKILVRNIPFEAKRKEIHELFSVFGALKYVRMPKKMSGTGAHRGFAFVDFLTKHDAKRAFGALCHSTHLYGRRLVLEWANTDDDSVEQLRDKTAQHYGSGGSSKKLKKSGLMDELKLSTL